MKTEEIAEKARELYPDWDFGRSVYAQGYMDCEMKWQEKIRWIPIQEGTYPEVRDKSYRILVKSEAGFVSTEIILSDYTHYDFENLRMFYTHWREIIE